MLKKLYAWLKSRLSKGKSDMNDIVTAATAVATDVKTGVEAVAADIKADVVQVGAALEGVVQQEPAAAAAVVSDFEGAAAKIKDACDKLGIALPAQWSQVIELVKVL